jgi:hypothetical protein
MVNLLPAFKRLRSTANQEDSIELHCHLQNELRDWGWHLDLPLYNCMAAALALR